MGLYVSPGGNAVAEFEDGIVDGARARLADLLARRDAGEGIPQHLIDQEREYADWTDAPPERIAAHHAAMARSVWLAGAPDPADADAYAAWQDARALALAAVTPEGLDAAKDAVRADLANLRWRHETGGVTVGGAIIRTDRESQGLVNGGYAMALRYPDRPIRFKGDGGFVMLSAAQMIAIGDAVGTHVQMCFAHEGDLDDAIDAAATPAALAAIDIESGWPA